MKRTRVEDIRWYCHRGVSSRRSGSWRGFLKLNPFEVWGDGTQIRNWTYIDDIVAGTIAAGVKIDDGTAINLGTMERIKVIDAVKLVMEFTGHKAKIKFLTNMPTGPLNRVADNSLATKGAVPRRTEAHHRLVLQGQGPRPS
jgi:nucleoside-diphosphate-sugar epimerase